MSRQIEDPQNLSYDDKLYIATRPKLRQEFILQGFGDPLEGFDFSVLNPNNEESYGQAPESDPSEGGDVADWNKSMPKAELRAAIDSRNEGRESDDLIDVEDDATKQDLIDALTEDDEDAED